MIKKILSLAEKYREPLMYLVFGVLTTAVNWAVYFPLYNLLNMSATVCTVISWVVAVAFAFVTNKPFVFQSRDWSRKVVLPELLGFVGCRIGSGLVDAGIMLVFVDLMQFDGNIMKLIGSVLVMVINYIGSKILFKNK